MSLESTNFMKIALENAIRIDRLDLVKKMVQLTVHSG